MSYRTVTAILLLVLGGYGCVWAYNHGVFASQKLRIPIELREGATVSKSFSISEPGSHDVELEFPKTTSNHLSRDLETLAGNATLQADGTRSKQISLPTHYLRGGNETLATVILTFWPRKIVNYGLVLDVRHISPELDGKAGILMIRPDPRDNKVIGGMLLLGILMMITGLIVCIFAIRTSMRNAGLRSKRA